MAMDDERGERMPVWQVLLIFGVLIGVVVLILAFLAKGFYVDWLWFASVGFEDVYVTILGREVGLFAAGSGLALIILLPNVLLARRLSARRLVSWQRTLGEMEPLVDTSKSGQENKSAADDDARRPAPDPSWIVIGMGVLLALALGWWATGKWKVLLLLPHQTPFGIDDPLFGRDVSYYLFTLPVLQSLRTWALWVGWATLLAVVAVYMARLLLPQSTGDGFRIDDETGERRTNLAFGHAIRGHVSLLGAAVFGLLVWHYRLRMFELVYSTRSSTFGAGYTDVHAYWPVLWALLGLSALGAVVLLAGAVIPGPWAGIGAVSVFVPVWFIGTLLYPALVQRLQVAPNELQLERPFIERNIEMTRRAYGLDLIQEAPFLVAEAVTRQEVEANPTTLRNIRLWDYEPLLATYNQIQSIRGYYDFVDADFDRYIIDGEYRQVMIAGRELSPQKLPPDAQTWVNRRLQFTHGYGVVVSPVNEVTPEGLPTLFVQDVPPRGKINVTRPEIYYGEAGGDWVVTKTKVPEFDFPRGSDNAEVTYQGDSGVNIGSFARRALFAWQLRDFNLLVTPALQSESQILFNRNVHARVRKVAPFLLFDTDPYLVVANGRLVWIYDAYTASRHFPYAQPATPAFNYLRNSVKVTIDAYDGSMEFFVADDDDPIIRAYSAAFPGMFRPLDEMAPTLRTHVRYPGVMFQVQAQMYRLYHTQDVRVFYQREDQLDVPRELYLGQQNPVPVQPYYAIMRLPGEPREEFVYILPYTPPGKDNMITWLAARSDGANYGKLVAFKYPKDTLIFGPMQVEARIDQDPTISAQFTLWNQGGSRVLRGNMLAIPIGRSNLYIEPVYLQAERSRLPEMKRVIVATGNRVAMGTTVEEALAQLYDGPINLSPVSALPGAVTGVAAATPPPASTSAGQPAPVPVAPSQSAAAAVTPEERQLLLDTIRALQQRFERQQEDNAAIQGDLRRLAESLERGR